MRGGFSLTFRGSVGKLEGETTFHTLPIAVNAAHTMP